VTIGMNLRKTLSGSILALAMAAAMIVIPMGAQASSGESAPAGVSVCNTASQAAKGGDLSVDSRDQQSPVHNTTGLKPMNGGSYNAAMHSRALSLCSIPSTTPEPPTTGDTSGGGADNT
jgi:hypothetical protein